jgi:hypothetical protein
MAQIPRPPKQGNVMTYVAKVAAGYPHILAGEMDADLDTIYGAWNSGADTVNIRDGAVTSAKLAADSVGPRELQDSGVGTSNLSDACVTTSKLVDGCVTGAKLAPGAIPPPASNSIGAAQIIDLSVGTAELADAAVTHTKLAPGALPGNKQAMIFSAFTTNAQNQWVRVVTLPALTTRGANPVFLYTLHGLTMGNGASVGILQTRWVRDNAELIKTSCRGGTNMEFPVPTFPWLDIVPAAGNYVYAFEVFLGTGITAVFQDVSTLGGMFAFEIG